jgi:hypothetical protein
MGRLRHRPRRGARRHGSHGRPPLAVRRTETITGTLLVCDAWFDVLTSRGLPGIAQAASLALFVELPLAALCFWMARNLAHAVEVARPFLRAAGFTIADNKLVPPGRRPQDR